MFIHKNTCFECEAEGVAIHHHHVVPRSRGGTKTIPLCEPCHSKAHHRKKNMNTSAMIKEGLKRARARGSVIGRKDLYKESKKAQAAYRKRVDEYNKAIIIPIIKDLRISGIIGYTAIARHLNSIGIKTVNGKKWFSQTVKNLKLQERYQHEFNA